jgi:integrase/recombinase XerC
MSKDAPQRHPPLPEDVVAAWWAPFGEHLARERRCSPYTVRNYRAAFEDFYRWLATAGLWERGIGALGPREIRDFVIEAQRRYGRRTLHNHVSGLRSLCRFWMRRGRLKRNPFLRGPPARSSRSACPSS